MEIATEKYFFPIIAINLTDPANTTDTKYRFLGTGFYLDNKGVFATCSHVLNSASKNERLFIKDLVNNSYCPIINIKHHDSIDLSIGQVEGIENNEHLIPYDGKLLPGFDICAFGYHKLDSNSLLPRFQKGHIVSIYPNDSNSMKCNKVVEVSFPSIAGFSGTPIWEMKHRRFFGMLHTNLETSIQVYSFSETEENGNATKESIWRVTELGIAHPAEDIIGFYNTY